MKRTVVMEEREVKNMQREIQVRNGSRRDTGGTGEAKRARQGGWAKECAAGNAGALSGREAEHVAGRGGVEKRSGGCGRAVREGCTALSGHAAS